MEVPDIATQYQTLNKGNNREALYRSKYVIYKGFGRKQHMYYPDANIQIDEKALQYTMKWQKSIIEICVRTTDAKCSIW